MTHNTAPFPRCLAAAACSLLLVTTPVYAGPGAHGPNGEHLDAPTVARALPTYPRVEAQTETFELVAELRAGVLTIMVDRYNTNEPVLQARIDVESGPLKAVANFRPDQGDYVVTDANLIAALAAPGEHALVFTLLAGTESDLLDGTLVNGAGTAAVHTGQGHTHDDHGHDHTVERAAWIAGGASALGLLAGWVWWKRRRQDLPSLKGAL